LRNLNDIINPEDLVETESLTTLLAVIPKHAQSEWFLSYEKLHEFIMPRSSREIFSDAENGIYTLVCLKKWREEIKNKCRQSRFNVRDFVYDPSAFNSGKEKLRQLDSDRESIKNTLVTWCRTNFSEAFIAWAHLKTIRIFVESILRFGLPPNFDAILLEPTRKGESRLREMLNQMFIHLASVHLEEKEDSNEIPVGLAFTEKFYPYVFTELDLSFEDRADKQ